MFRNKRAIFQQRIQRSKTIKKPSNRRRLILFTRYTCVTSLVFYHFVSDYLRTQIYFLASQCTRVRCIFPRGRTRSLLYNPHLFKFFEHVAIKLNEDLDKFKKYLAVSKESRIDIRRRIRYETIEQKIRKRDRRNPSGYELRSYRL